MRFRPDLEGLRGIAVILVVLYHAGVPGMRAGSLGVDVFYVLSGYLITAVLQRELATTGKVDLAAFYRRRARRILPAAFTTLAVTLAASLAVFAPLDMSAWPARRSPRRCSRRTSSSPHDRSTISLRTHPRRSLFDPSAELCDETACRAVVGGTIAWRDDHHLTATIVRRFTPLLDAFLLRAIGR